MAAFYGFRREPVYRVAAVTAALAAGYPATAGPARYAVMRGWLPESVYVSAYHPLFPDWNPDPIGRLYGDYLHWWYDLGIRHAGIDPRPIKARSGE